MLNFYRGFLHRLQEDDKQTLGVLSVYCGTDLVFSCKTLELPWRSNKRNISRIPSGVYDVSRRHSDTYGDHWHIKNVYKRDLILIHNGNYHRDTEGCVCVGRDHHDINNDGYLDTTSSVATLHNLNNSIPVNHFRLMVI